MTADYTQIAQVVKDMEHTEDALHRQISDICYWMKGGISWDEAWALSFRDRERLIKNLNEKIRQQSGDTREYM
jgi:hypothetical protein